MIRRLGPLLGPAPLGESIEFSTVVIDRNGQLLRPYATVDGRWPSAGGREGCRPAPISIC
jgi:membrane carboxypeptidase/penicillin-binding protein PbpC